MTKHEAVELLLARMNSLRNQGGLMFGVADGTPGNINILAREMNLALYTWRETGDSTGMQQMAGTLLTMGSLNGDDYDKIMQTLDDGEK